MEKPYLRDIAHGIAYLDLASMQAEALVGDEIKKEHTALLQSRQIVAPWHYLSTRHPENIAVDVLSIVEAFKAQIQGLWSRIALEGRATDLSLRRTKTTIEKERERV